MICAISGEVPEEPVVSKKSGLLFERRLIERYVLDHGACPVTKESLSMDDIVAVKTNKVYDSKSDTDDDGSDDNVERSEVEKLPPLAAKIARQAKFLRQRMGGVEEDIHEEDDQDEEKGTGWGRYKSTYFGADNADFELLSSDDELHAEEDEALRMQREKAKMLSMDDFGLEDSDKDDNHDHGGKEKPLEASFSVDKSSANSHSDEVLEASENFGEIKKDLDALSKEEQMNIVYSSAPELAGILLELGEALEQCKATNSFLSKMTSRVKDNENCKGAFRYLEVKRQIYLVYCQAIGFYLLLKSEGQSVRDHPLIARLVEIRGMVEKVKKIDRNMPSEMETLPSSKNIETHQQKSVVEEDSALKPKLSIAGTSAQLCEREMDSLAMVAADKDHGLENAKIQEQDQQSGQVGLQSKEMLKLRAILEEKMKHKGIYNSIGPKKPINSHPRAAPATNKCVETVTDFDDEVTEPVVGRSKQKTSVHSAKLSQIVGTKGYRSMFVSGDDDLPRRDDIGERRRKHELRVLARAGAGSMVDEVETLPDDNGNPKAKKMDNDPEDGIDGESEDEFYKEVKRQRISKLSARAGKYSRTLNEPSSVPEAEEMTDGKRLISQQIEKNRGLTRHRRKDSKNPRKKYKMKHKKAMVRRKGQVRDIRKPSGPYGGETTGINIGVSRSIRFKN